MGHCGPHPHTSSDDLLFWADLLWTIVWGVTACFCGALSVLGLSSILKKAGIGISFPFGGITHDDLAANKFVEAGTVLGHWVSSTFSGMAAEAVAGALGCKGVGFRLGINGTYPPWGFCIEDLGTSWIFVVVMLYTVNGIAVVGHFVDVAMGFVIRV